MFRAPRPAGLPHLHHMLDDLPGTPQDAARLLDVSTSTMNRYIRSGGAPRAVMLALFWETRWGRSRADCEAANAATTNAQHASMLRDQNARLHRIITRLELEREHGRHLAANGPVFLLG